MDFSSAPPAPSYGGASGFDFWLGDWDWWMQTWVDDQNGYLLFVGRRDPERMILVGRRPDGTQSGMRMVWHDIIDDEFSWDYQKQSEDGTWSSQWNIAYRRRS